MPEDRNTILALILVILLVAVLLFLSALMYAACAWVLLLLLRPLGIQVSFFHVFIVASAMVILSSLSSGVAVWRLK